MSSFSPLLPSLGTLALAGALALVGCGGAPSPEDARTPGAPRAAETASGLPPVVLISIDTLRADRLPAYGYDGVETPAIDGLARDGVVFENAYSHFPLTLPSHASLFSGLWPNGHGVRDNMGYRLGSVQPEEEPLPHLPSLLSELGYRTGAAVSSFVLRAETGMGEGFDFYDDQVPMGVGSGQEGLQRRGPETVGVALDWLDAADNPEKGPPFLFVHLFEPHTPYAPPSPFAERYASPYDGEIAAADAAVGSLLDGLRERGLYDGALIVLLSDHGESLGEHGEDEHGLFVYRSTQHVPLVVKLPSGGTSGGSGARDVAGLRIAEAVQLVDVLPTVLDALGQSETLDARLGSRLDGRSLLPLLDDPAAFADEERVLYAETYYPRLYFGWSELRSVIVGSSQYIHSPSPELFELDVDPAQKRNLLGDPGSDDLSSGDLPSEDRRLYASLRQRLAAIPADYAPPAEVDTETRERLVSLGYVGAARSASKGELPAPADQVHLLAELKRAHRARSEGDAGRALRLYEKVLAENPRMLFAWEQLGRLAAAVGDVQGSARAYRRAFELSNGASHLAFALAEQEITLGRLEEARTLVLGAADSDPLAADLLLARIATAAGDGTQAEARARAALERNPESAAARLALARALALGGHLAEAASELEAALPLAEKEPAEGFFQLRADLLARAGRTEEALEAFSREIELFPGNARAHAGLALLQATLGQVEAARETFDRLLADPPSAERYATAIRFFLTVGDRQHAETLRRRAAGHFPGDPRFGR